MRGDPHFGNGLPCAPVPDGADPYAAALPMAAALRPSMVMAVVPEGRAIVQGSFEAVEEALAAAGAAVLTDPDRTAFVGLAGAFAALARGHHVDVVVDDVGAVIHHWSPHDGSSLVLGGAVWATAVGCQPAIVVAGDRGAVDAALADDHGRDLVRILRYDDAVDTDDEWRTVAPDVLDVPFWTREFCATVIRGAEATGAFTPQDGDPVPGHEVSLATISPALFDAVEQHVAAAVMPVVHQVWPFVDYHGLRDAFVIKYAPGGQTELRVHHDVAQLSGSIKLNDGYDGCRLEFPRQSFDNASIDVGRMLVWPSLVTHPHRAAPLVAGVKYALTVWFEVPGAGDEGRTRSMARRMPIVTE